MVGRMLAAARGDVPVEEVRTLLQGGGGAYEDILAADRLRTELISAGLTPTTMSPAESGQLLCAWVAYALQSLAEAFVEAEEQPGSLHRAGFITQVTSEQIRLLANEVPTWIGRARRASTDPGYDVAAETPLPADFPGWVRVEPCPTSHLVAMHSAASTMFDRLQLAAADFERSVAGADTLLNQLRGLVAQLQVQLDATPVTAMGSLGARDHEATEAVLRDTVTRCFTLGQLMSRPRLLRGGTRPPGWQHAPRPAGWGAGNPYSPRFEHHGSRGYGHYRQH